MVREFEVNVTEGRKRESERVEKIVPGSERGSDWSAWKCGVEIGEEVNAIDFSSSGVRFRFGGLGEMGNWSARDQAR